MEEMVECVMNVSEGRDRRRLDEIEAAIAGIADAFLLDRSSDADHHRSVLTFVGNCSSVEQAAFAAARQAVKLIDLRRHRGVHPRMGAVDVIPFVPLGKVTMDQCIQIARRLGERIASCLRVPVYLYGEAATRPQRRPLAALRRGEFEGLAHSIVADPERKPDFGPARVHPTAGATAVGARPILIAYNIYLDTPEVQVARKVASRIRRSAGGLPGVQALGFFMEHRNQAQVSMNVTDYRSCPLPVIFQRVGLEAERWGSRAQSSEIVGLAPRDALAGVDLRDLRLEGFDTDRILENRIAAVLAGEGAPGKA